MNRLGQMNTGPTIKTLPTSEECGTDQSWQNSSCFCCDCTPTDQSCCLNETTDKNCSPSALHCVKESNTWYNMFAPGKTVVNQSISGMVPWIDLSYLCFFFNCITSYWFSTWLILQLISQWRHRNATNLVCGLSYCSEFNISSWQRRDCHTFYFERVYEGRWKEQNYCEIHYSPWGCAWSSSWEKTSCPGRWVYLWHAFQLRTSTCSNSSMVNLLFTSHEARKSLIQYLIMLMMNNFEKWRELFPQWYCVDNSLTVIDLFHGLIGVTLHSFMGMNPMYPYQFSMLSNIRVIWVWCPSFCEIVYGIGYNIWCILTCQQF